MKVACPDCGERFERANLNQHAQICSRRQVRCAAPGCGQSFSKADEDALVEHLVFCHRDALLANHSRLFAESSSADSSIPAASSAAAAGGEAATSSTNVYMTQSSMPMPPEASGIEDQKVRV